MLEIKYSIIYKKVSCLERLPNPGENVYFETVYGSKKVGFLSMHRDCFISYGSKDKIMSVKFWLEECDINGG